MTDEGLPAELDAFAAQVDAGAPPAIPAAPVLATVITFEAIIRSVETGAPLICEVP
jgi:hypothetical protein